MWFLRVFLRFFYVGLFQVAGVVGSLITGRDGTGNFEIPCQLIRSILILLDKKEVV